MFSRSPRRPAVPRSSLQLESLEARETPALYATGSVAGAVDSVTVYDSTTSLQKYTITPFGGAFTGGARVALADLNGDGNQELVVAPGAGGGSVVKIYNAADGTLVRALSVGDPGSRVGVGLATTNLGQAGGASDIVVGTTVGGVSTVKVIKGDGTVVQSFVPFAGFTGGLSVAAGDVNGDGTPDYVVGAGAGGAPRVAVFDGKTNAVLFDQMVFEASFTGGVTVTSGDLSGDGKAEVVVAAGPLGGPRVEGFNPAANWAVQFNFFAFDSSERQGAQVSLFDTQHTGKLDIVAAPGPGEPGGLAAFDGRSLTSVTVPPLAGLPTVTTLAPTPTITSVSPTTGPLAGGTSVVITGTNLSGATAVKFGTTAATSFTVNSATQITATAPAGTAGQVDITVTTPGGTTSVVTGDKFTYQATPTITSVSPATGSTAGGTSVVITGTNFTGATAVKFGSTAATSFTVNSATQITALAPVGTAGAVVDITVTTPSGTSAPSAADKFTYTTAPTVSAVSPSAGPVAGGTTVTITGTNFTGATAVKFGSTAAANVTVNSATQITATAPAGTAGTVDVTVTTPSGTSAASAADKYTYQAAPTVTQLSTTTGPTLGGTSITITGTNLTGATAVKFGSTAATNVTVVSATQITATVPAGAAGQVDVTVTTPGGTSAISAADKFTYAVMLAVGSVTPNAGPLAGGTAVTITGTNFTGATAVMFGGTAATNVTVVSATQITATAPAGTAGAVDVTVTTPSGTSPFSVFDKFSYLPAPTVTSISPAAGPLAGGTTVAITGTNFAGTPVVTFGGVAATSVTLVSATQINAVVPAGAAGPVDVVVTTAGGTATAATKFTYQPLPTVTGVSPATGPVAGGTTVTLTGTDFTGATAVKFGTVTTNSFTVQSATSIQVTVPAGVAGPVDITVTTPGGTSATSAADMFTYVPSPTVTSISPVAGPLAGGTTVTITGTNFTGATGVTFGGVAATNVTVVSATQITATAPAGAAGAVDVIVTTPGGGPSATSAADKFTYEGSPTVTGISPVAGPLAGGTTVTITGTNLLAATGVTFGGVPATSFTVKSATQITATAPAGTAGAADVVVTTASGTSATSAADQFTYQGAPTVTQLSATTGPTLGGTTVTITGTNFLAATGVTFGGVPATSFTVDSATQITAVVPAKAAGAADVVVTTGSGTSATSAADQFTYAVVLAVGQVAPNAGPLAGGTSVVITGTNFTGATGVSFGGVAATSFTVNSDAQITAVAPAGTAGTVDVTVTTPAGTSPASVHDKFTYQPAPTVTQVSPATGPSVGGTTVTITGTNFTNVTGVSFGGVAATSYSVTSPTTITAVAPTGAAGAADIRVTTAGGTSATSAADQFTYTLNDDSGMVSTLPNVNTTNWQTQADGLKISDVVTGSGTPVAAGASVTVFYTGWLTNGTVFDSRRSPSTPLQFSLNHVIQGWQEGIVGMKPGGIRLLYIPAALAYGAAGSGSVPPNADLVFEVKLISSP